MPEISVLLFIAITTLAALFGLLALARLVLVGLWRAGQAVALWGRREG